MNKKIGPTGQYPNGELNEYDEGELILAVGCMKGNVIVDFGKPVAWIALPPYQAIEWAQAILKHALTLIESETKGEVGHA